MKWCDIWLSKWKWYNWKGKFKFDDFSLPHSEGCRRSFQLFIEPFNGDFQLFFSLHHHIQSSHMRRSLHAILVIFHFNWKPLTYSSGDGRTSTRKFNIESRFTFAESSKSNSIRSSSSFSRRHRHSSNVPLMLFISGEWIPFLSISLSSSFLVSFCVQFAAAVASLTLTCFGNLTTLSSSSLLAIREKETWKITTRLMMHQIISFTSPSTRSFIHP